MSRAPAPRAVGIAAPALVIRGQHGSKRFPEIPQYHCYRFVYLLFRKSKTKFSATFPSVFQNIISLLLFFYSILSTVLLPGGIEFTQRIIIVLVMKKSFCLRRLQSQTDHILRIWPHKTPNPLPGPVPGLGSTYNLLS